MKSNQISVPMFSLLPHSPHLNLDDDIECQVQLLYCDESLYFQTNNYLWFDVQLQMRGPYLLEVDHKSQQIRSGIKMDENFHFQLESQQNTMSPNNTNQWISLRWRYPDSALMEERKFKYNSSQGVNNFIKNLRNKIILEVTNKKLEIFYSPKKNLGKGRMGTVTLSCRIPDKQKFAIKGIPKKKYQPIELQVLKTVSHDHICKIHHVVDTGKTIYLALDYYQLCLQEYLKHPTKAKINFMHFAVCSLKAINHLHEKGFIHRDIKPANIMLRQSIHGLEPILIDFDLAQKVEAEEYKNPYCGTPGYIAPEILQNCLDKHQNNAQFKKYDQKCDVFSLGSIFYHILCLSPLFYYESLQKTNGKEQIMIEKMIKNNRQCKINFKQENFICLPTHIQLLLRGMLAKNPQDRMTGNEALSQLILMYN